MKAFVWTKNVSDAYGKDGFVIVLAPTLEEARAQLKAYLDTIGPLEPRSDPTAHPEGWNAGHALNVAAAERNRQRLEAALNNVRGIAPYGLEPPGDWAGACYRFNWHTLLEGDSDLVLDATVPRILAASYGYEG